MKRCPFIVTSSLVWCLCFFFQACGDPDVSIAVKHYHTGNIIIDSQPLQNYDVRKTGFSSGDTLYMLELPRGNHVFEIQISDSINIRKKVFIQGEAYYGIDFGTGEVVGFED